jgi:hypothetical protein
MMTMDAEFRETTALALPDAPQFNLQQAIESARDFERLKSALLDRNRHITVISGKDYVNAAGWSVLGTALNVSCTLLSQTAAGAPGAYRELLDQPGGRQAVSYSATVRATAANGRHEDAPGRCDSSEKRHAHQTEHGLEQIACTRARSKAIARLIGGAQGVVAEEVDPVRAPEPVRRYSPTVLMQYAQEMNVGDFRTFIARVCPSCEDLNSNRDLKRALTPAESVIIWEALESMDG